MFIKYFNQNFSKLFIEGARVTERELNYFSYYCLFHHKGKVLCIGILSLLALLNKLYRYIITKPNNALSVDVYKCISRFQAGPLSAFAGSFLQYKKRGFTQEINTVLEPTKQSVKVLRVCLLCAVLLFNFFNCAY